MAIVEVASEDVIAGTCFHTQVLTVFELPSQD
jgi:hypothetical protein